MRRRWVNRKAPNAGARSKWIALAWDCPQNGVDHFETPHNIKMNSETGFMPNTYISKTFGNLPLKRTVKRLEKTHWVCFGGTRFQRRRHPRVPNT